MIKYVKWLVAYNKKSLIIYTIVGFILSELVFLLIIYSLNGGRFTTKEIDPSLIYDENFVRAEKNIESASTATVIVKNFDYISSFCAVTCKFENYDDIDVFVYLSKNNCSKLNIGDMITVRGRVNCIINKYSNKTCYSIFIGNSVTFYPFIFKAALIDHSK